jgi:DNA-binding NarL/FixJ family response regulator
MNVLVIDDHGLVGEALAALLEQRLADAAVQCLTDARVAIPRVDRFRPSLVLFRIAEPGIAAIEPVCMVVREMNASAGLILLSTYPDAAVATEALRCGARGLVLTSASSEELLTAIGQVAAGQTYITTQMAGDVVNRIVTDHGNPSAAPRHLKLSVRESQTLELLADGLSVKEIAYRLNLSDKTVHAFRASLMNKLDLTSIAAVTKYAIRHGLTTLDER